MLTIWVYCLQIFAKLRVLIVRLSFNIIQIIDNYYLIALDSSTKIYTLATSGNDNLIKIWRVYSIVNGRPTRRDSEAGSSDLSHGSRLVPTSLQQHFSGTATIYPTSNMNCECVHSFPAHGSSVTSVKFNTTGTLLISGALDRLIKFWDLQGNCLKTLSEHSRYVNSIAINVINLIYFIIIGINIIDFIDTFLKADSTILASGGNDKQVHIWDLTGSFTLDSHISNGLKSLLLTLQVNELDVPMEFVCPITSEIMSDPVLCEDGFR